MSLQLKPIIGCLFILFLVSCGAKKKVITPPKKPTQTPAETAVTEKSDVYDGVAEIKSPPKNLSKTESYVYQFSAIAMQEMRLYGIPASITLAQGILEFFQSSRTESPFTGLPRPVRSLNQSA